MIDVAMILLHSISRLKLSVKSRQLLAAVTFTAFLHEIVSQLNSLFKGIIKLPDKENSSNMVDLFLFTKFFLNKQLPD